MSDFDILPPLLDSNKPEESPFDEVQTEAAYTETIEKGLTLWQSLNTPTFKRGEVVCANYGEFMEKAWVVSCYPMNGLSATANGIANIIQQHGLPSSCVFINIFAEQKLKPVNNKALIEVVLPYCHMQVDPKEGIILMLGTRSPYNASISRDHDLVECHLTPTMHLPEIVFHLWKLACRQTEQPMNGIRLIKRCCIANLQTRAVVGRVRKTKAQANPRAWTYGQPAAWTMAEEDGLALLGTPNGTLTARLFLDYGDTLGHKTIEKVVSTNPHINHLAWHLKDNDLRPNAPEIIPP